jgi:heat shock protein HtpX
MATIYTHQSQNIRRTFALFGVFLVFIIGVGFIFSQVYGDPGILYLAVGVSIIANIFSYYSSDTIALAISGARPVERKDYPQLYNIVENLAITAGLPMPRLYVTSEMQINAFATGRNPQHAAVAVTEGALQKLNKTELEGVLAHELSHIGNRDILVSTVAVVLAGTISIAADFFLRSLWFGGGRRRDSEEGGNSGVFLLIGIAISILAPLGAMLLQLAISRRRESLADATGVLLTRYPEGLASALEKIASDHTPMAHASSATAHLWIDTPFKEGAKIAWYQKLFLTHPPVSERIAALRGMAK